MSRVTSTRWLRVANASCSKSLAPERPASTVVVTSTPRRRNPMAMAGSRCSSRWYRISKVCTFQSVEQSGTTSQSQPRNQVVVVPDLLIDLLAMIVIVCQRGIDIGQGELREAIYDFVRRQAPFRPESDVLDTNPMPRDARPASAYPGRDVDVCV